MASGTEASADFTSIYILGSDRNGRIEMRIEMSDRNFHNVRIPPLLFTSIVFSRPMTSLDRNVHFDPILKGKVIFLLAAAFVSSSATAHRLVHFS